MIQMEVTSLSSKGQVVIPSRIRKTLRLSTGSKLMVVTDGANVLLKPIQEARVAAFEKLIDESRKFAKEAGLKKSDVARAIRKVRRERRG